MTAVSLNRKPPLRLNPAEDGGIAARPPAAGSALEDEGIGTGSQDFVPRYPGAFM